MKESRLRILITDDEPEIRRFLCAAIRTHQHEVIEADSGLSAIERVKNERPDLLILDLGLPDLDGVEVIRQIRMWNQLPIIILSVKKHEFDKIEALEAGADDYLTKPFSMGELLARIRVILRRGILIEQEPIYQVKDLTLDLIHHQVTLGGNEVQLTPTEFDILKVLIQNPGKVVTQRQLIHKVWGTAYEDEARLLRVNISNLRHKIEPDSNNPVYIQTEIGIGYRLRNI